MYPFNQALFAFIKASPSPFHAVREAARQLENVGFDPLCEGCEWRLIAGHSYYVTRNQSSLIAFGCPEGDFNGFMLTAAHDDTPTYKVKDHSSLEGGPYVRLACEGYGGMLCSTFLDRPLSAAGRFLLKTDNGIKSILVDSEAPCALIPNVAIHMNRTANSSMNYNQAVDMLPLYSLTGSETPDLKNLLSQKYSLAPEAILASDLYLYNPQEGIEWSDFISAPKLDDLQCAFSTLRGFLEAGKSSSMPVYCLFDNEEVGSTTKQGAAGTFLYDTLERIKDCFGLSAADFRRKLACSMMLSCDNAHAIHPNHPEYADKNHTVLINQGIVIKFNANAKYTSDGVSAALFRMITDRAGVPTQTYANRADLPGGSTLGNISSTQVSLNTVDIGLGQLAMHSSFETAGNKDTGYMISAVKAFFESSILMDSDGSYRFI